MREHLTGLSNNQRKSQSTLRDNSTGRNFRKSFLSLGDTKAATSPNSGTVQMLSSSVRNLCRSLVLRHAKWVLALRRKISSSMPASFQTGTCSSSGDGLES